MAAGQQGPRVGRQDRFCSRQEAPGRESRLAGRLAGWSAGRLVSWLAGSQSRPSSVASRDTGRVPRGDLAAVRAAPSPLSALGPGSPHPRPPLPRPPAARALSGELNRRPAGLDGPRESKKGRKRRGRRGAGVRGRGAETGQGPGSRASLYASLRPPTAPSLGLPICDRPRLTWVLPSVKEIVGHKALSRAFLMAFFFVNDIIIIVIIGGRGQAREPLDGRTGSLPSGGRSP